MKTIFFGIAGMLALIMLIVMVISGFLNKKNPRLSLKLSFMALVIGFCALPFAVIGCILADYDETHVECETVVQYIQEEEN
jgi:hypothetical protein